MKKLWIILIVLLLFGCESKVETLNKDALKLIDQGNYTEAINVLKLALEEDMENDITWNNISLCYDAIGEFQLALEAAQKAVNIGDENEVEYTNLGNAYYNLGNIEEARLAYEKALAFDEDYYYAIFGLGVYYGEKEEYTKALEKFYYLYDNNPINVNVIRYIAFINFQIGKVDEAIAFLEQELDQAKSEELEELLAILKENRDVNNEE